MNLRKKIFNLVKTTTVNVRMVNTISKFNQPDGGYLAYNQYKTNDEKNTNKPGVIFLCGYASNVNGIKATFLEKYCKSNKLNYTRFSYNGHDPSTGTMDDFNVGVGLSNTLDILDNVTTGPQVLVGSSMGGWVALLTTLKRPQRMHSILTINNAVDFICERFSKRAAGVSCPDDLFDENDVIEFETGISFTKSCIEDAKNNQVLSLPSIEITCPVTLIHGMQDEIIPYQTSINAAEKMKSLNVEVRLVKNAMHRFSEVENLEVIKEELDKLLRGSGAD